MKRTEHFSRHKIDLEALRKLQDLFGADGELDESGFVTAFGAILGDGLSRLQLSHLFMKIDANSDGSVDWDELLNFMFLDNQENDSDTSPGDEEEAASTQFFPASYDVFELNNGVKNYHKEQVTSLQYLDKPNKLLSASRDGVIRLWHPTTLAHQATFHTGVRHQPQTNLRSGANSYARDWISDVAYMSASNKLAVSSIDSGVTFLDMAVESRKKVGHIPMDRFQHAAPLCLGYHHDASFEREMLLVGDDSGSAHVFFQDDKTWSLGNERRTAVKSRRGEEVDLPAEPPEAGYGASGETGEGAGGGSGGMPALRASHDGKKIAVRKHTDHVTSIEYVPDLSALVTSSLDSTVNVYDLERSRVKRKFTQHKKAVYSFAWSPAHKVIASSGLERHIVLWSPYSRRSVASLHGHTSSVIKVTLNEANSQVISLSADNTVKVWDIRNHRCIQTIGLSGQDGFGAGTRKGGPAPLPVTCMTFVSKNKTMVAASNKLKIFPLQPSTSATTKTHSHKVVSALYNASFHQVISVDEAANLSIWNLENGDIISRFKLRSRSSGSDEQDKASTRMAAAAAGNTTLTAAAAGINTGSDESGEKEQIDAIKAAAEIALSADNGDESLYSGKDDTSVTALCFDDSRRRIITGSHGSPELKIWNFSNGCLLKTLLKTPESEPETCSVSQVEPGVGPRSPAPMSPRKGKRARVPLASRAIESRPGVDEAANPEVTRIAYVVNVLPRIPGHAKIKNKYIVSVGWDRKIYAWTDGNSTDREQGYSICMPHGPEEQANAHTDDIMTVSFVPPDIVATGGYDGRVIMWCLSSGRITRQFNNLGPVGIEASVFVKRQHALICSRSDGTAFAIDTKTGVDYALESFRTPNSEAILALAVDISDDQLATGDESGYVQIWDAAVRSDEGAPLLLPCARWQAHDASVTSLDFVQENRHAESFLLTSCSDGLVQMWTVCGVPIGQFGQLDRWELSMLSRFDPAACEALQARSKDVLTVEELAKSLAKQGARPETLDREASLPGHIEKGGCKSFPNVGEVWIKLDTDWKKSHKRFLDPAGVHEQIHPKAVADLMTVTRQDEVRGEVKGWSGLDSDEAGSTGHEVVVPITDFLKGNETGQWIKDTDLTEKIGRIYRSDAGALPYKVAYIRCSKSKRRWFAIDTFGAEHDIQYRTSTYCGLQAPRSISLYYRRATLIDRLSKIPAGEDDAAGPPTADDAVAAGAASGALDESQSPESPEARDEGAAADTSKESAARPAENAGLAPGIQPDEGAAGKEEDGHLSGRWAKDADPNRMWSPSPPSSNFRQVGSRGLSTRQRMPTLRQRGSQGKDADSSARDFKQKVHEIADIPLDFSQLRAALSISSAMSKQAEQEQIQARRQTLIQRQKSQHSKPAPP